MSDPPTTTEHPMLYSPQSRRTIDDIREQLGVMLARRALGLAKSDGRNLITDDDIWDALDTIDLDDLFADPDGQ